jgi:imidazolonepropionase-like amidohydrolase
MDNRHFHVLGHATGRLLLKRPGYDVEIDRIIEHARVNGCFFEINSSPVRLDLSAEYARRAVAAGVMIAVSTDSHSTREFDLIRWASIRHGAPPWQAIRSLTANPGNRCHASSGAEERFSAGVGYSARHPLYGRPS